MLFYLGKSSSLIEICLGNLKHYIATKAIIHHYWHPINLTAGSSPRTTSGWGLLNLRSCLVNHDIP